MQSTGCFSNGQELPLPLKYNDNYTTLISAGSLKCRESYGTTGDLLSVRRTEQSGCVCVFVCERARACACACVLARSSAWCCFTRRTTATSQRGTLLHQLTRPAQPAHSFLAIGPQVCLDLNNLLQFNVSQTTIVQQPTGRRTPLRASFTPMMMFTMYISCDD